MIDFIALKLGLETFEADAVDAYYQATEHEKVIAEPAPEDLRRLDAAGRNTDVVWRLPETVSWTKLCGTPGCDLG